MNKEQDVLVMPEPKRKRISFGFTWVFILFILLVALLLFYAFGGNFGITGNVVGKIPLVGGNKSLDTSQYFEVEAEIGALRGPIEVRQIIEEMSLEFLQGNYKIRIGRDNIVDLSALDAATLHIKDFDGTVHFDGDSILRLKGSASLLTINNIPSTTEDGRISLEIAQETPYTFLSLSDIRLKHFDYRGSGTVTIDKDRLSLNLQDDELYLRDYVGSLESGNLESFGVQRQGLLLKGLAKEIDVGGAFNLNLGR